ncbi:MAG: hypothetical protein K8Q99_00535 [Acholeplasmataceae bacterium]|nr:hypothetical protein [Acholeplasmataceae bacterium]
MKRRILAAIPMISLMLFLISGLFYENWKIGWSFFLLIPFSWILLSSRPFRRLNDLMPMISLIVFFWLGFGFGLWHPAWVVFLIVPLVNMITEKRIRPRKFVTIVIVTLYVAVGVSTKSWHPEWVMLLLIPIINTIFFPYDIKKIASHRGTWKKDLDKFFNDKFVVEEEKDRD